jgi:uncharacterized protein
VDLPSWVTRSGDAAVINAFVQPRSAKEGIVGVHGAALKIKVSAPPADGRANAAVEKLLARTLGVARSDVAVVSGQSSRHKRIRVGRMTPAAVADAVALVLSSGAHDRGQEAFDG